MPVVLKSFKTNGGKYFSPENVTKCGTHGKSPAVCFLWLVAPYWIIGFNQKKVLRDVQRTGLKFDRGPSLRKQCEKSSIRAACLSVSYVDIEPPSHTTSELFPAMRVRGAAGLRAPLEAL